MKKMIARVTAIVLALGMTALFVPSVAGQTALAAEQSSYVLAENNNETDAAQQEQVLEEQENDGISAGSESSETEAVSQEAAEQGDSENINNEIVTDPDIADVEDPDLGSDTIPAEESSETDEAVGNTESDDAPAEDAIIAVSAASISLENASVTGIKDQTYTGSEIRPAISVTLNGKTLTDGTDYVVNYSNNIKPGTATITIEGKGNYTGVLKKSFQIQNAKPVLSTISNSDAGVTITWQPVKGASQYRVFRKDKSGKWTVVRDTSLTSSLDRKVEFGHRYTYTVRCISSDGSVYTSGYDTTGKSITYSVDVERSKISYVDSGILRFKVKYDKVAGASGYEVRYSLNPDMSSSVVKRFDSTEASLLVGKASEGIYFVQVRAFKTDYFGNKEYSAWSEARLAKYVKHDIGVSEETLEQFVAQAVTNQRKKAILYAFSRVGYPYSQTQRSSGNYYDCSSLVYYAWQSAGISLTKDWVGTAAEEARALQYQCIKYDQLTPGSLLFFSSSSNGRYKNITHVAMYVGSGMIVEAANSRVGVVYRKLNLSGRGTLVSCCDPLIKGGWIQENGERYFYVSGNKVTNSWREDTAGWRWLDANGKITKSKWIQSGGQWYYINANGYMATNCWVKDSTGWCWMNGSGRVVKSQWIKDNGAWYYLDAEGHMVTGRQTIGGKVYNFYSNGKWVG